MEEPKRLGRQTPTKSVVLPYENTYGQEAIDIYEKTGRQAQDWQKLLIYDPTMMKDCGFIQNLDILYLDVMARMKSLRSVKCTD